MWIIDRVKDDQGSHNSARCHSCGYAFNMDLFVEKDVKMIMQAHDCNNSDDSFYSLF